MPKSILNKNGALTSKLEPGTGSSTLLFFAVGFKSTSGACTTLGATGAASATICRAVARRVREIGAAVEAAAAADVLAQRRRRKRLIDER